MASEPMPKAVAAMATTSGHVGIFLVLGFIGYGAYILRRRFTRFTYGKKFYIPQIWARRIRTWRKTP